MSAMAELGDEPAPTRDVAARAGDKHLRSASLHRDNLIHGDLISSPVGLVAFTVPLFAAYMRENHPLARFDE
jgi:hypothetical protein